MAQYKSETAHIAHKIDLVFSKLSNPGTIGAAAENLPEQQREILEKVEFSEDAITVKGSPMGNLTLRRTQVVEPTRIVFEAEQSPVPFKITFNLTEAGDATDATAAIDIEIPVFLRPMVSGPMEKATAQFAELLQRIPYDKL